MCDYSGIIVRNHYLSKSLTIVPGHRILVQSFLTNGVELGPHSLIWMQVIAP